MDFIKLITQTYNRIHNFKLREFFFFPNISVNIYSSYIRKISNDSRLKKEKKLCEEKGPDKMWLAECVKWGAKQPQQRWRYNTVDVFVWFVTSNYS